MKEIMLEAVKSAPPVSVGTMTLLGIQLSDWTLILTGLYTLVLLYVLVRDKIVAPWLEKRRSKK
jgi:hypothetical protein